MRLFRASVNSTPRGRRARKCAHAPAIAILTLVCLAWFATPAPAVDLDALVMGSKHDEALGELERARQQVDRARANAVAARERLEAFLARHFEDQPAEPPPPEPDDSSLKIKPPQSAQIARLKAQLDDLVARRQELLGYLTEEHPEVVDAGGRIAALEEQIAILEGDSTGGEQRPPSPAEQGGEFARRWRDYANRQQMLREQDAEEYGRLYDEWQAAEGALDGALDAEDAAAEHLEAIESAQTQIATPPAPDDDSFRGARAIDTAPRDAAAVNPPPAATTAAAEAAESGGSQPLVLAALLIALAVAALAAVRLARSTADPIFTSADEVAAALAIPVVGIIPAAAARVASARTTARRRAPLAVQLLMAAAVFALVAYLVQNPAGPWQVCNDALQALTR
jgi:hypothetical protein